MHLLTGWKKCCLGNSVLLEVWSCCCQATTLNRAITTKYFGMERNLGFPSMATSNYSANCCPVIDLSLSNPFSFVRWRLWRSDISVGAESSPCFPDNLLYTQYVAPSPCRQAAEHSNQLNPYLRKPPCSWRIQISCTQRSIWNTFLCFSVCNRQKHKRLCGRSHLGWTWFYGSPSNQGAGREVSLLFSLPPEPYLYLAGL